MYKETFRVGIMLISNSYNLNKQSEDFLHNKGEKLAKKNVKI